MLMEARTTVDVEGAVHEALHRIMAERNLPSRDLLPEDKLNATLGLRSLDLAQLVFDLETTLGGDPFEKLVPITSVRTVADLVGAYRRLFEGSDQADETDELLAAQRAGELRRARRGVRE